MIYNDIIKLIFKIQMHQDISHHNHLGQMSEASRKPLRRLNMQPLESGGHRAWRLTLVWKESKCMKLTRTTAFSGQGEERAMVGAACTSKFMGQKSQMFPLSQNECQGK